MSFFALGVLYKFHDRSKADEKMPPVGYDFYERRGEKPLSR